ncbi:MAG: GNAT family N-acetyltransferase, partial [Nostocales cyanobacterium 94392]|nr:GNAT family N-acetyltransferase [Nostocales cyanobacterium 94392]
DTAARVFGYMWQSSYNLRGIYETPVLPAVDANSGIPDRSLVEKIIHTARQDGRTILTEFESKEILAAYGIPVVETCVAKTEDEAVECAEKIGYPVVVKLYSHVITHKTDVGGVQLNIRDADAVRQAYRTIKSAVQAKTQTSALFLGVTVQPMVKTDGYELIIGSSLDPQFGPVLLFGAGGQLVEVFQDRAIALPPLNTTLARRMMEHTKIYKALQGVRGRQSVDMAALEQLLVAFSQLVVEQRWIKEIDINPLLAIPPTSLNAGGLIALDARIVLHAQEVTEEQLPELAIRPYPSQYVGQWTMKNGTPVTIRPIRPEDEPLLVQFHQTLSEESVYLRYFHLIKLSQRITHERLTRICFIDYDREMALVAEYQDPQTAAKQILAVARLSKLHGTDTAEFSMLVSDRHQCQGLGTELLRRLIQVGRQEKIGRITASILTDNYGMQRVFEKLGFRLQPTNDSTVMQAEFVV